MSNPKLKVENYQQFGGINQKMTPYQLSPMEFLDIKNFDFFQPGSLSKRWGSTQYTSQAFGKQINTLFEYNKIDGSSYVIAGLTGGIWAGATTGNYQGLSLSTIGVTFPWYSATLTVSSPEIVYQSGGTGVIGTQPGWFGYKNNANISFFSNYSNFNFPALQGQNVASVVSFQDWMFYADGDKFIKFNGTSTYPVGLPIPMGTGSTSTYGITVNNAAANSTVGFGGVTNGLAYGIYVSYVNNRGFESQISPLVFLDATRYGANGFGGTFLYASKPVITPLEYGISSINVYSFCTSMTLMTNNLQTAVNVSLWNPPYVYLGSYAASGSTFTNIPLGTTVGNFYNMINNVGPVPDPAITYRNMIGQTLVPSASNGQIVQKLNYVNYFPKYIDIFANRLMLAGFSSTQSRIIFSEAGEPEGYQIQNYFDVRPDDGDAISGIKSYANRLMIFKDRSITCLFGDDPTNFYLHEISTVYGCVNNRCIVDFDDYICWLDRKGIVHYNGSTFEMISDKIQPIFDRMNYDVAKTTAIGVHDKLRNQVMFAIPVDGATQNNLVVVYDYLAKAWTTQDGYVPTAFRKIKGSNNTQNVFYGNASGTINWFGPSFMSDNGNGFTTYIKTRFLHDMGESVQKQFRRLYLNVENPGTTYSIPLKFYQDYGSSVVYSVTMSLGAFQDRLDFGISAKSLAFELYNLSANSPLRLYGFTIESRLQRRV